MKSRVTAVFLASALLSACVVGDDPEGGEDEGDGLSLQGAGGATPDGMIRVANVNLFKGSFGEEKTDGRNFLLYLAKQRFAPDIFAVQNLDHSGAGYHNCADVANKLSKYLEPKNVSYAVYNPSERGGSCIIYRAGRFDRLDATAGLGPMKGAGCNDRTAIQSVGVKLRDKRANKTVAVVSVHMSGNGCTKENTEEIRAWANSTNADIRIIAGDFNTQDKPGYGSVTDMANALQSNGYRAAAPWGQLDWIWRKGQSAIGESKRVEYAEAQGAGYPSTLNYSDHRGGFEDLRY